MAPGVVDLALEAVVHASHGGQLQTVVVAVGAGGELRHCAETRIGGLTVRKRGETAGADGLISVDLGEIGLVHGARAYVLRLHAAGFADLVLDAEAPLHEVWSVKSSVGNRCDRDRRKASGRI